MQSGSGTGSQAADHGSKKVSSLYASQELPVYVGCKQISHLFCIQFFYSRTTGHHSNIHICCLEKNLLKSLGKNSISWDKKYCLSQDILK